MKNNTLFITAVFVIFLHSLTACKTSQVSGQNNDNSASNTTITKSEGFNNNSNQKQNREKTRNQPETKTIKLQEKVKKENLTKSDYLKLSKVLGWDGFCRLDAEINNDADTLNVPFYKLGENEYLL